MMLADIGGSLQNGAAAVGIITFASFVASKVATKRADKRHAAESHQKELDHEEAIREREHRDDHEILHGRDPDPRKNDPGHKGLIDEMTELARNVAESTKALGAVQQRQQATDERVRALEEAR